MLNPLMNALSLASEVDAISIWKILSKQNRKVVPVRDPWTDNLELVSIVTTAMMDRIERNKLRTTFAPEIRRVIERRIELPDLFLEHAPVPPSHAFDAKFIESSPMGIVNLAIASWISEEQTELLPWYSELSNLDSLQRLGDWSLLRGVSDGRCLMWHIYNPSCRSLLEFGTWLLLSTPTTLFWIARPKAYFDDDNRVHRIDGPAIETDVKDLYFLHGVSVPERVIRSPETLSVDEILEQRNTEVRRSMLEMVGFEKFLVNCSAIRVDRKFNYRDGQWEELYRLPNSTQLIRLVDPSTGRKYFLDVPRDLQNCEQAQLWMSHGLDKFAVHRS